MHVTRQSDIKKPGKNPVEARSSNITQKTADMGSHPLSIHKIAIFPVQ
jgi:hypothetical protein